MKNRLCITAFWVMMTLSYSNVRAQDTNRVPEGNRQDPKAVNASVQAEVEECAQRPQPFQQPTKQPMAYSHWGFQSADQPPAPRFRFAQVTKAALASTAAGNNLSTFGSSSFRFETQGPDFSAELARAADSAAIPENDDYSGNPDRQSIHFSRLSNRPHDQAAGSELLETAVPSNSPQPQPAAFSTTSRERQFGRASIFPFANPFPKTTYSASQIRAEAKTDESLPQKSRKKIRADAISRSSRNEGKKVGTRLTTKSE
jgi:hypothetical protein